MKKARRIFALIGAIILVGLYITTLVSALIQTEFAKNLFFISLSASFILPATIYGFTLFMKALTPSIEVMLKEHNN
ncbi:MAG: hypothetical protein K0R15_2119 [Clostridiales bacterium]|nr:hypothetical protein [Clostridiales bacterium]